MSRTSFVAIKSCEFCIYFWQKLHLCTSISNGSYLPKWFIYK